MKSLLVVSQKTITVKKCNLEEYGCSNVAKLFEK